MLSTLVPLGLRANDRQLVDVSTVPRGKQYGCAMCQCIEDLELIAPLDLQPEARYENLIDD